VDGRLYDVVSDARGCARVPEQRAVRVEKRHRRTERVLTAGRGTQKFQWKDASGTARVGANGNIKSHGGHLLILWSDGPSGAELWEYDGTNTNLVGTFPHNFYASSFEVAQGLVYVSGSFVRISNGSTGSFVCRPAIYWFDNDLATQGKLWESQSELAAVSSLATAGHPAIAGYGNGIVFTDEARGVLLYYDLADAALQTIGSYTVAGDTPLMASTQRMIVHTRNQAAAYLYPDTTTVATSGSVSSSLQDFNLSLDKFFKSVKIDAEIPSGASIDLAYQLESVDGAYTSISTGVSSGVEYDIGQSGRSLSIKVTLNKGSSSAGPTLKRVSLRAAPVQSSFKLREYYLDLTGRDGHSHVQLRNGVASVKDGYEMAADLIATSEKTTPFDVTDEFGTYSGVIDFDNFVISEVNSNEFIAKVKVREV
jgi:hypothetical protein